MKVLVIGATGMLGEPVARRLHADGRAVRILARDPPRARSRFGAGFEVVSGDVTRPDTLRAALEGCDGVHLNLRGGTTVASYVAAEQGGCENVARLAAGCGIRRISYLAGAGDLEGARAFPLSPVKAAALEAIRTGPVPYTIFRATHFMESLRLFLHDGRASLIGNQPHRYHYLAAADYARMVSRAFDLDAAANRELVVFGPQAYTMLEALQLYCARCHPGVRVGTMPLWLFRLLAALRRDEGMTFAAMLFAGFTLIGESGDPAQANRLFGAPATTLAQWCEAQASADGAGTS